MKSKKTIKNFAFIDGQNVHLGVKSCGWTLDYRKFRLYLKNKYFVQEAFLFIGQVPGNEALYTYLQRCGYILVFKPTLEIKKGKETIVKGNVDAELVLHAMIEFNNYNMAFIVSNDGDFHCLIDYLFERRKLGKIVVPNKHYSKLLHKFERYIVRIDMLRPQLEQNKKTKISGRSKP